MKRTDTSRVGDLAEHYAITWLWDNGYQVFKNCGCTGPIDMIALHRDGTIKLIVGQNRHTKRIRCTIPAL